MKIIKTKQGNIEIYPFDIGNPEPKGLETSAIVMTKEKFDELLMAMIEYRRQNYA